MGYGLSFSEEFFTGDGTVDLYEMPPSERPTNVLQAIISLPRDEQLAIARDVMGSDSPDIYVDTESFPFDVLDKVRAYDYCDDLSSPINVYISPDYWVTVYEEDGPDKPYFVSTD